MHDFFQGLVSSLISHRQNSCLSTIGRINEGCLEHYQRPSLSHVGIVSKTAGTHSLVQTFYTGVNLDQSASLIALMSVGLEFGSLGATEAAL